MLTLIGWPSSRRARACWTHTRAPPGEAGPNRRLVPGHWLAGTGGGAARLSVRRIHLAALLCAWRRRLRSAIGVAVGVTVVLGTLVLKAELTRPFEAFGPSLAHAAATGVVEQLASAGVAVPWVPG